MKHSLAPLSGIILAVLLGSCNNFFHELIPSDDTLILSFEVEGQLEKAVILGDTVMVTVAKETDVGALVPVVRVSGKATLLPVTPDYVSAAFPNAELAEAIIQMNRSNDRNRYVIDLIKANPDFNVPAVTMPIDFSGPVTMLVIGGMGSIRQYTVYVAKDTGDPRLFSMRFAKYDNAELISDAVCVVDEARASVYVNAVYPAEIDNLSYALIPSFSMLGDGFEVDGNEIVSGVDAVRFNPYLGEQTKTITITRDGISKNYALTVVFTEDADSVRSITDFRFNKTDNDGISANAVGSITNTDNTGTITVQVYYSGAKPTRLTPSFISPGTVSVGGVTQISGANSHDFSSPVEYRVVSRNGMYTRIYTVKAEFINISSAAPHITAFRFSAALNGELVQDAQGQIIDGTIYIDARYGGDSAPTRLMPEFSAQGIVTVSGSVQVSGASAQDFTRQVMYTVTNPENPNLSRDYWVRCVMIQDTSSYAAITSFGFYPEDNPGLENEIAGKIDQINGKITVYAPAGSGVTDRMMIPRFTASGQVNVKETAQVSGVSGRMFDAPVTYTVVSANGRNTRNYAVSVREPKSPIYVNCNAYGLGDGSSWENAFTTLKGACEAAAEFPEAMSKEIWIAVGTYTPGRTQEDYLRLTANTSYIGGFAGWETDKSQRNVTANTVTISGDLGGGVYAQNLFSAPYTVVIYETSQGPYHYKNHTEINGGLLFEDLSMEEAKAEEDIYRIRGDGAIYANLSPQAQVGVTRVNIKNCTDGLQIANGGGIRIENMTLRDITGYGIQIVGMSGEAFFSDIKMNNIGSNSLAYNGSNHSVTSITLQNSEFVSCDYGATLVAQTSITSIHVSNTTFLNMRNGRALFMGTDGGDVTVDRVTIDGVISGSDNVLSIQSGAAVISNTVVKNCKSAGQVIFIYSIKRGLEITNTIIENCIVSGGSSGVLACYNGYDSEGEFRSEFTITDTKFINCTAPGHAKIITLGGNPLTLRRCEFTHDANLQDPGRRPSECYYAQSLFSNGSYIFEECTFNNLRVINDPGEESYFFDTRADIGPPISTWSGHHSVILRNCIFNFSNTGRLGLAYFINHSSWGWTPNYFRMEGCKINNYNGQQLLLRLAGNNDIYQFQSNNYYNNILLDTAAKLTGLGSNIVGLENGAGITITP
jgi:hypothetical protein